MRILGYQRPDGQLGIRNKVSIIFSTDCSRYVAQKLYHLFPVGTQILGRDRPDTPQIVAQHITPLSRSCQRASPRCSSR